MTLGGLSVLGGCVTVAAFGVGFALTLPLSLAGFVLAIIAWRKQERGPTTIVALVLNGVSVLAGVVLIVLVLSHHLLLRGVYGPDGVPPVAVDRADLPRI
jgi:hypothetical protein